MKKIKSLLLAVIGLLCSVSVCAHDFEVDGIYYNITSSTDRTVAVTYRGNYSDSYSNEYSGAVSIPESVTYNGTILSVTSVEARAFYDCSRLTSVVIPNSITIVGEKAFSGCSGLTSVNITDVAAWCNINFGDGTANPLYYAKNLYLNGEKVTDLVIPDGITIIGNHTFYGCKSLVSVVIPNSVTCIEKSAFCYCSGLTSVVMGNSITRIGDYAFYECSSFTSVDVPNNVTSIGDGAFYKCSSLKSLEIPNSVTNIGKEAFYDCSGLTSVVIGNDVTSIGGYAFQGCSNLYLVLNNSDLTFTKGNATYGYVAYYAKVVCNGYTQNGDFIFTKGDDGYYLRAYMGNETEIDLPVNYNGEKYAIGSYAFYKRTDLKSVSIPNNVTKIGSYAFQGCSDLNSLTVGSGVLSVGNYQCTPTKTMWLTNTPPSGWNNLKGTINYVANDQYGNSSDVKVYPYLSSIFETDGVKFVPVSPSERTCDAIDCNYDGSVEKINIGETVSYRGVAMKVQSVMPYTAYKQTSVKDLTMSNKGDIGNSAFFGCTSLNTAVVDITKPDYELTFDDWTSPKTSHSSTSTKTYTFTLKQTGSLSFKWLVSSEKNCDKLIVTLDGSTLLTKSGEDLGVFTQSVGIGSHTLVLKYSKDGNTVSGEDKAFVYDISVGEFGAGISAETFRGCTSLTSLTLGDSITAIGASAFRECSSLTEVKVPNKVKSLGASCFRGSGLESISIPASVTSIGDYAFEGCTKMADVVIEDRDAELSLGSNGSSPLFADCPLDSVYIGGNITYNTSSNYGYSPFYRNTSLQTVVITDKEEEISDNEFYGCTNLKNVTIGGDVKKIGNWAFSGCSNLDYFSFGKSVETIGQEAFSDCVNLTKLISYAEVPPTCGTMALDDINKWNCVLQIPQSCLAAYQQADQWKEFFFIEDVLTAIGGVTVDGAVPATADVYSTNGMLIKRNAELKNLKHELPAGVYIIGGKKVWVK